MWLGKNCSGKPYYPTPLVYNDGWTWWLTLDASMQWQGLLLCVAESHSEINKVPDLLQPLGDRGIRKAGIICAEADDKISFVKKSPLPSNVVVYTLAIVAGCNLSQIGSSGDCRTGAYERRIEKRVCGYTRDTAFVQSVPSTHIDHRNISHLLLPHSSSATRSHFGSAKKSFQFIRAIATQLSSTLCCVSFSL